MKSIRAGSFAALLLLAGCVAGYKPDEALLKGDEPVPPTEFKKGTATLGQVKAWSASLLSYPESKSPLEIVVKDLDQDGTNDLLVADPAMAGTGGNNYLAFIRTPHGYRYAGHLGFGDIRILPKDASGQTKLVTWWHLSAGEGAVTLVTLDPNGMHEVTNVMVHAGDQGTAEGNRIADELFGTNDLSPGELNRIFGTRF